jgi:hypothetical protein
MAPLINTTTDVQRIAGQSAVENPLAHRVVFEQLMDNSASTSTLKDNHGVPRSRF